MAATTAAAGYTLHGRKTEDVEVTEKEPEQEEVVDETESEETVEQVEFSSEKFAGEQQVYEAYFRIDKNHIQFADSDNRLVGEPVLLESFVGDWPEGVRKPIGQTDPQYNYKIAEDEHGIPKITKRWRQVKQATVQAQNANQKIEKYYHSHADLRAAAKEKDEPGLVRGVEDGSIQSYEDIVNYFAHKEIPGFDGNRIEYLQTFVTFRNEVETVSGVPGVEFVPVPQIVQDELIRLLPGLVAQESKFSEGLVNENSGAAGPCQFIADTWKRYTGEDVVSQDFVRQVEVIGPCLSDMYDRLLDKIGESALSKLRAVFPDEDSFLIDLIVPCTINSYNAGPDRVAEGVRLFVESNNLDELKPGKDLFITIADFVEQSEDGQYLDGYKEHAREYTSRVYANASVLGGSGLRRENEDLLVAQN